MLIRLTSIILIFTLTSFCYQIKTDNPKFICKLTSDKTIYKIGEVPKLEVRIINKSNKVVYLIGSLEGSDHGRMPNCYFDITKPKPDTMFSRKRCGWMNKILANQFIKVNPNEEFNPYESNDKHSFWVDDKTTNPDNYRNPGVYIIRYHYSTTSKNIRDYLGNVGNWSVNIDSAKITNLFNKVLNIVLESNQLEIKFEK